jgi:TATA-box binding protein (TBP) (component of TFIID and TFIIIB)
MATFKNYLHYCRATNQRPGLYSTLQKFKSEMKIFKSIKADITGTNNQIKETATNAEISTLYSRDDKQAANVETNRYSIVKSNFKSNG